MTINASTDGFDTSSAARTLTERVVDATADVTGADPLDLPPLYEAIDPDALDALYDRDGDDGPRVEFAYAGCGVTVRGDGSVSVTPEPIEAIASAADETAAAADSRADAHQDC